MMIQYKKGGLKYNEKCYKSEVDCWKHHHNLPKPFTGKCCALVNSQGNAACWKDSISGNFAGISPCISDMDCVTNYNVLPGEQSLCCDFNAISTYGTCLLPVSYTHLTLPTIYSV